MKYIVQFNDAMYEGDNLPLLRIYAHGHPHKRQAREVLQKGREELWAAAVRSVTLKDIKLPIDYPIDLYVMFQNPASPDLDHLIESLFQMLDGKSLKGPSILTDDRLIQKVTMVKYYPNEATKRDGAR